MEPKAGAVSEREDGRKASPGVFLDKPAIMATFDRDDFTRRMGNNRELCKRVLGVFVQDTPRQLARLNQAVAAHDALVAQGVAHSIKGAAASVGAEAVRQAAYNVETAAREGLIDNIRGRISELEWAFASFLEVVSRDSP